MLRAQCGKDATQAFLAQHSGTPAAQAKLKEYYIGYI